MSTKMHRRVAEVLGMEIQDDNDDVVEEITTAIVPIPDDMEDPVDNPELPALQVEMTRIEHGQRQTELLIEKGIGAVITSLDELPLLPPQYQPRAREAASELFRAVSDLSKHKIEIQIKLAELKMKQAAFTRNKAAASQSALGSNNTIFISREELIKTFETKNKPEDDKDK
jgi:hypothetical protein